MTELRAGTAVRDITPSGPIQLSGYGPETLERVSEGVHLPLEATALVLSDGELTIAVVSVDLLNVSAELTAAVRDRLADVVDYVLLAATHTHAAPYVPATFLELNPLLSFDVTDEVETYVETTEDTIVGTIRAAHDRLSAAEMRVGRASNEAVPVNRRDRTGPIDPKLAALQVTTTDGTETLVVNFACHPVCSTAREKLVSGDWPGVVRERVRAETDAEVLFLNGATGDVNPAGSSKRRSGDAVYEYMAGIGERLSDTTLAARRAAARSDPRPAKGLSLDRTSAILPIQPLGSRADLEDRYESLTEEIERLGGDEDVTFLELQNEPGPVSERRRDRWYLEEKLRLQAWGDGTYEAPVTRVGIGEVDVVSVPGEAFVQHGLDWKAAADADALLVAGFADDYAGYFPTVDAFDDGGYEVRSCKFVPEAIDRLRGTVFDLVS